MFVRYYDFEELLIIEIEMKGNEIMCLLSSSEAKIMNGGMPYSYLQLQKLKRKVLKCLVV
jgi:hypothetical protein